MSGSFQWMINVSFAKAATLAGIPKKFIFHFEILFGAGQILIRLPSIKTRRISALFKNPACVSGDSGEVEHCTWGVLSCFTGDQHRVGPPKPPIESSGLAASSCLGTSNRHERA